MDDYFKSIDRIVKDVAKNVNQKLGELDKMYKYKPVRAKWFLEKAKLLVEKEQKRDSGVTILRNKVDVNGSSCIEIEIQNFYAELDKMYDDSPMADYRYFQINQMVNNDTELYRARTQLRIQEECAWKSGNIDSALANCYLKNNMIIEYFVLYKYTVNCGKHAIKRRRWIEESLNLGYLDEAIQRRKSVIIIPDYSNDSNGVYILGYCFAEMGCPTYVLSVPEKIDVDVPIDFADTLPVSMENASELHGFKLIPTVELLYQKKSLGNNCSHIINTICKENETVLVLASSRKFEELSRSSLLKNRIENLYSYQEAFRTDYFAFGWCGSYLDYISQLYQMDAKEAVYREPECKFSIVIPVRNSAATLQHTIKTCLNQRYQGDYEIVISDNSADGNTEVWQYCQSLKDNRVKYYKTPRNLNLSRSFEYAFLQSRGEFVFSIGADDAVLPWTLDVLEQMREKYPEEEVILWDRGFYAWPGFNGGQENEFCIPNKYEKGHYHEKYIEPIVYLAEAIKRPGAMYALPMLYINSGFKRSFMQTLLNETGRLWDGICQDIYMGTIVSVIKEHILYLAYPLAIAGMSSNSIGALSTLPMESQERGASYANRMIRENNVGGFSKSQIETFAPELGSDVSSLYNCILRAVNRGLLPARYLTEVFDWKQWFLNIYSVMSKKDVYFDRKIHQMRFAAMKHGQEFLKWFDETIYEEALTPVVFEETDNHAKTYREEYGKRIVLDASTREVHNVCEAAKLFEEMTGL